MTRFGHKINYEINTFVKHTPDFNDGVPGDTWESCIFAQTVLLLFSLEAYRSLQQR